jgi:hypothetical protein
MSGNFHITVAMSDLFTLPETQKKMREALQAAQTQQGLPFLMVCYCQITHSQPALH